MVHLCLGQSLFLCGCRGQPRLWCWGSHLSVMHSPALAGSCPTAVLWVVGAICWVFFGWAELALCYVLSLSSFLQGFLYDLDKVSGISVSSPLYSPSLCLGCATASPALLALPCYLVPWEGEGLGLHRQGSPGGQGMKQR